LPDFDVLVVAGFGGGLVEGFAAGELVVASEVRFGGAVHRCPGADRLAALLPAPVRTGAVVTGGHVVSGAERGRLAATGAVAADMESGPLVAEAVARGRPFAVVRAVVDSPERPLLRPATLHTGAVAYRRLRALRPLLVQWAREGARPETRR
jgi:4-hydroxy-3-methylbut-2-enyl diphosphate reductase